MSVNNRKRIDMSNIDRRDFLRVSALLAGGVLANRALSIPIAVSQKSVGATSVIYVFLEGGPSQTDTFDPKPKAGKDYAGAFRQPISTNVNGIEIGEMLPNLAKIADKYSIIRSMTHGVFGHETACYTMETGTSAGEISYPSFGAVIAYKKRNEYKGFLPSYISLTTPSTRFNESGFLGVEYKPFCTGGDPSVMPFLVEGILTKGQTASDMQRKRELLAVVDKLSSGSNASNVSKEIDGFREKSFDLVLGDAKKSFDLSTESEEIRKRYGATKFGQSCLVARKLAEQQVPFITVRFQGWDTHKQHFERMNEKLPDLDRGLSALISDLSERKMLDNTIVICGGEFGRTPKILWEPPWNGGRGHFGTAFSYLVAGGGFVGAKVIGETDNKGETVVSRPVYPWDLVASIYSLMGIDPNGTLSHPRQGAIAMLPQLSTSNSEGILREIMVR